MSKYYEMSQLLLLIPSQHAIKQSHQSDYNQIKSVR